MNEFNPDYDVRDAVIAELQQENAILRDKLYGERKLSKCCGAILIPYRSHGKQWCPKCETTYPL